MVQPACKTVWWVLEKLLMSPKFYPLLRSKYTENRGSDVCVAVFTAVLLTMAKGWKQPTCPPTKGRINKRCRRTELKYYSAIKRNGALTHATTWMNLKGAALSEIS